MTAVQTDGALAFADFSRFDLNAYRLFLQFKKLPESQTTYNWQSDTYRMSTAARFASRLGAVPVAGMAPAELPIADHLFDYQRWAVKLALDAKRFALWLDTGLGKTATMLEWARQVQHATGGRVLILAPLAVLPQTAVEAERWYGGEPPTRILKTREDLIAWAESGDAGEIGLCNYEKLIPGEIAEFRLLAGLICDESSLLKTGGGTIKWNLIKSARGIEYKLSCTATPAPNDAMEYASQASFLEKLRTEGEILWTFFTKGDKGDWSIKSHAKTAFYRFLSSWSLYLRDPAAFGFGDILASLPAPVIIEESCTLTDEQRMLMTGILAEHKAGMFADQLGVVPRTKLAQIARGFLYEGTGKDRAVRRFDSLKMGRVVDFARREIAHGRPTLIWTAFDEEAAILAERFAGTHIRFAVLTGATPESKRLELLEQFRSGALRCLISKPQLIGYGLNLQFVKAMIFSGFDDSFERTYQAIRRAYRFGQTDAVRVFFPYVPELEGLIFANVKQKETRFLAEVAAQERLYRAALADQLAVAA